MIIDNPEIKEKLKQQSLLFRELMNELNGKVMDYESCRMLEEFLEDYTKGMISYIEIALNKISEDYDLVKKNSKSTNSVINSPKVNPSSDDAPVSARASAGSADNIHQENKRLLDKDYTIVEAQLKWEDDAASDIKKIDKILSMKYRKGQQEVKK